MPPLPVIADVFRGVLRWSNGGLGAHAVNVLNVHTNASGKTAQQVYTCLDAHVTASMWGFVSTGASVITVDILPLDGSSATQSFSTGGVAKWTGTATGETIPQVAEIIKLQTGIRGPSHRGRIYLPFITAAEQGNGGFS